MLCHCVSEFSRSHDTLYAVLVIKPPDLTRHQPWHTRHVLELCDAFGCRCRQTPSGRDLKPIGYRLRGAAGPLASHIHSTIGEQHRLGACIVAEKVVRAEIGSEAMIDCGRADSFKHQGVLQQVSLPVHKLSLAVIPLLSTIQLPTSNCHHGTQHYTKVVSSWYSRSQSDVVCQRCHSRN